MYIERYGFICEYNTWTNNISLEHNSPLWLIVRNPDPCQYRQLLVGKQENVHWLRQVSTAWWRWGDRKTVIGYGYGGVLAVPSLLQSSGCKPPAFSLLLPACRADKLDTCTINSLCQKWSTRRRDRSLRGRVAHGAKLKSFVCPRIWEGVLPL